MPRLFLLVELLLIFGGLPLAYRFSPVPLPALPLLWVVAAYAWWQLTRDKNFNRRYLWNSASLRDQLVAILLIFGAGAFLLWMGVRMFAPQLQWSFMRQHPGLWALIMVLYPVLSVYPQGVLYRAFFLHRYSKILPNRWMLLFASAAAFGFLHIIFRNPIAVVLTFAGGILFATRYQETKSLFTSSVEHALYGCWLFTVGLGQYFYHGVWPQPG